MPLRFWQLDLRDGGANPPQRGPHEKTQMPRELGGLIEAARALAHGVEWDRHDAVHSVEQRASSFAHQRRQVTRNRSTSLVLQGVNDLSQGTLIFADRPSAIHRVSRPHASRASGRGSADDPPGRQGVAATVANRGCHETHGVPACVANRPGERRRQHGLARGAPGSKDDRQHRIRGGK